MTPSGMSGKRVMGGASRVFAKRPSGGSVFSWTPLAETPNFWFRADTLSLSGTDVLSFTDKSGNGYNATFSGTNEWTYNATDAAINNAPSVSASGDSHYAFGSGVDRIGGIADKQIVWAVYKSNAAIAAGSFETILIAGTSGGTREHVVMNSNNASYGKMVGGHNWAGAAGKAKNPSSEPTFGSWMTYIMYFDGVSASTTTSYTMVINGTTYTCVDTTGGLGTGGTGQSRIGAWHNGNLRFTQDIAECGGIVGKTLDATMKTNFSTYFNLRYGLT